MFEYADQVGNIITFLGKPKRIISIVPSQSEFLWDLGLKVELTGISKFCVHPDDMFKTVERVGGTKDLDIDKIRKLKPDLIIGNKEENERSQIEILQKEFNVWVSDIYTFEDAFTMMMSLGEIVGKEGEAGTMVDKIKQSLSKIKNTFLHQKVAYFIWRGPYMVAASNTFINHVLNYVGFENACAHLDRYPELNGDDLKKIDPGICFLSSEPFPFKEKHIKELQEKLPGSKIMIVDGEMFSWYGSRLQHLEEYIATLPIRHRDH